MSGIGSGVRDATNGWVSRIIEVLTASKKRLLVVDDDPGNREALSRAFQTEYEIHAAADGEAALELARRVRPEVIVTDQLMPRMSGVEFLTHVREEMPHTVRVLITGQTDYESLVDAVNVACIHHYVEKPFHTVNLKTIVRALLRSAELEAERDRRGDELERMVSERTSELAAKTQLLETANQRLHDLAMRDGLTGLHNHSYLIEHLRLEVARSVRYKRQFALLFVDLDRFKEVNDQFGHQVGDIVLTQVGKLLKTDADGMRGSDLASRYGGDEFCLVLPETDASGALVKAERVRQAVAGLDWPTHAPSIHGLVTTSIGIAVYPDHAGTVDQLVQAADAALYEAKRAGRNRVVLAHRKSV